MIRNMLRHHERRLIINLNDLRQTNGILATGLLKAPLEWLPPLEMALREVANTLNEPRYDFDLHNITLHVGFSGSFGGLHTTPRHLSARHLGQLMCLDGIVTSCSLVRPKLLRSVHYHSQRKQFLMREYHDATMLGLYSRSINNSSTMGNLPSNNNYPTTAPGEDTPLISEFGLSSYRDYQTITMQEMPERAPAGQLPRTVDVILDDDLVDAVKPGDRVRIVGVYKTLNNSSSGANVVPAQFRTAVVALNARLLVANPASDMLFVPGEDDLHNIRLVARRKDIFELLARSLAPSIYGHEWVKRAILLQLLGGVEKNLPNGTHLRGDINLMLVGDPSTAKSQMLRFVLALAPLAIATTGRGSSGVGLTAAVTTDRETGERRLEAGAMVLADRGIVCIDEFDKMSDADRVAIHEVMEQQTVTIAKAGIHTSLNARCSVLAAANPIWGQYRETASPQENIRLPDSLLSRFDLLFIVLDKAEVAHDTRISDHVLRMHRYIPPGLAQGQPINENVKYYGDDEEESEEEGERGSLRPSHRHSTAVFQKHYAHVAKSRQGEHGKVSNDQELNYDEDEEDDEGEILTIAFVKKYLQYARSNIRPTLSKAAIDQIIGAYTQFRQRARPQESGTHQRTDETTGEEAQTFPVTPRTLETLIRLATAHAKARLSNRVDKRDAKVAQQLVEFCLYKEVKKKKKKQRGNNQSQSRQTSKRSKGPDSDESSDSNQDEEDEIANSTDVTDAKNIKDGQVTNQQSRLAQDELAFTGLSLEEVASSSYPPSLIMKGGQSQGIDSQFVSVDNQLEDSLRGFVDASQLSPSPVDGAGVGSSHPLDETRQRQVLIKAREALNRLRSRSTLAVFSTTINELAVEIGRIDDSTITAADIAIANIRVALQEMQRLNQVMLSDDHVYII